MSISRKLLFFNNGISGHGNVLYCRTLLMGDLFDDSKMRLSWGSFESVGQDFIPLWEYICRKRFLYSCCIQLYVQKLLMHSVAFKIKPDSLLIRSLGYQGKQGTSTKHCIVTVFTTIVMPSSNH